MTLLLADSTGLLIDGYVWCDLEGAVHTDEPNPYDMPCNRGPDGYHHELRCVEDQSGDHYVCPGPHAKLQKVVPTEVQSGG